MSISRPVSRLLRRPLVGATTSTYAAPTVTNTLLRSFSSTPIAAKKPTIRELTPPLARYTDEELSILKEKYTPEQLQSLLMGEETINHEDFLARKGRAPKDPYKLRYLTDLSKMDPVWDFPPPEVLAEDPHATQPLPKTEFDQNKYFPMEEAGEGELDYKELAKQTGFPERTLKGLYLKKLDMHRVVNQTRLGKIRKMYCLFVAGNENGMVGIGEGKSSEPEDATRMATRNAIKNMMPIQRYQGRTVHGDMDVKIGAVEMKIMARPQGFGVRCSERIWEVCRAAGIKDLSVKVTRSRNPMNVVKTFLYGLQSQKMPETIARGRGIKLADVRSAYFGESRV